MKYLLANIGYNLVAIVSIAAAVYLIEHDKKGWGWFIFIAIITCGTYKFTENKD